jgi:peroxiredoxin
MRLFRKLVLLIIIALGLGILAPESWGSSLTSGKPAPPFRVESGDGQKLSLDKVRGRVVVLFYENRHVTKKNSALKDELTRIYLAQSKPVKQGIFRLVVIDCAEACLPTLPLWKRALNDHSEKEGFTIYGDWQRTMYKDYFMKADDSNFLVIDQQGIIRYSATGKVDPCQFEPIIELILGLAKAG